MVSQCKPQFHLACTVPALPFPRALLWLVPGHAPVPGGAGLAGHRLLLRCGAGGAGRARGSAEIRRHQWGEKLSAVLIARGRAYAAASLLSSHSPRLQGGSSPAAFSAVPCSIRGLHGQSERVVGDGSVLPRCSSAVAVGTRSPAAPAARGDASPGTKPAPWRGLATKHSRVWGAWAA